MTSSSDEILAKLPKRTPAWAVGLASIIVSCIISISAFYVVARPEVQQYMQESFKFSSKKADLESSFMASILDLIRNHAQQITDLARVLQRTQETNQDLSSRVNVIEKDLAIARNSLIDCETRLREIRK